MSLIFLTYLALTCSVGSVKLSNLNGVNEDQATCKMGQSAEACSAADEQTDHLQGEDAQSLMQVKLEVHANQYEKDRKEFQELAKSQEIQEDMEVQEEREEEEDLEPETEEIQDEMKEKEEKDEEEEDLEPETEDEDPIPPIFLEALRSVNTTTVDGRLSACHAEHYIAGFIQTKTGNFSADCKPCAQNCRKCWGPTMRECVKCNEPFATLLTRELPRPEFSCVEKCPVCYTKSVRGFCSLNRTCESEHTASEEYLPANLNISEAMSIRKMLDGHDPKVPITNISEIQENAKNRRRRRNSRRRTPADTDCAKSVKKMKSEVEGWDKDCYTPVRQTKQACDNRKKLDKALKTYVKVAKLVEKGTAEPLPGILKKPPLSVIPFGIGPGMKVVSQAATTVNGLAAKSKKAAEEVQKKLNHKTLKKLCKNVRKFHKKVKKTVKNGENVLDQFSGQCGCDCLVGSGQVDKAIGTSQSVRSKCRNIPSLAFGSLPEVSLPSWVEDVLSFVKDMQVGLEDILDHEFCLWLGFTSICFSVGHILKAVAWLEDAVTSLVEDVVFGLLDTLGINLGCNSISNCIDIYAEKYLKKIPGLSFTKPKTPTINPQWENIDFPEMNLFADVGCAKRLKDILGGELYNPNTCTLQGYDLAGFNPFHISNSAQIGCDWWPEGCNQPGGLDALEVFAQCPCDETHFPKDPRLKR